MNEWIEISAKTVNEEIILSTIQLGTTSNNMEYEVIEYESKGILGMF